VPSGVIMSISAWILGILDKVIMHEHRADRNCHARAIYHRETIEVVQQLKWH
jgi:hypothetical protein